MQRLYFDYNATTPLFPEVKQRITEVLEVFGNPSSFHAEGQKARSLLEKERNDMALHLGACRDEIIFTSGATESHRLLFDFILEQIKQNPAKNRIISTPVEHSSILEPLKKIKSQGCVVDFLKVNSKGELDWDHFLKLLGHDVLLISVMLANNETGIIFPVKEISLEARERKILVHTDATCAVGKVPFLFPDLGADFLSLSAHKFYGPKGVGAMLVSNSVSWNSKWGGFQERGRRPGTENIIGIAAMGKALELSLQDLEKEKARLKVLREKLKQGLKLICPDIIFHDHPKNQLEGTLNFAIPGFEAQVMLARLDLEGVAMSVGSACHSGSLELSHVLLAMGFSEEETASSLRCSFGRMTTEGEIEGLLGVFGGVFSR